MFISFDNVTNETLGFILTKKTIGSPSIKAASVSIPGADGELDLADYFGSVRYNNRTITLECESLDRSLAHHSSIMKALHGKKKKVRFNDDNGYYYIGRVSVGNFTHQGATGRFTATINAEPYKYKEQVTTVTTANNKTVTLANAQRPVVPTIKLTGTTSITFGDYSVSLSAGTYQLADIELKEGNNSITFSGSGSITITYQEGVL